MFEQKAFTKQHNSVFNGRVDTNRYASAFDSASLEPALTPSRSTDLRSEKSASYHNVSFADNLNPTSAMDADMPARSMPNIDFTQVVNTPLNTEVASSWNQTTAWNSGTGTDSSDFSGIRPAGFDWKKFGHGALDVIGALPIPVVSTAADLANAGWYAAEGDYKNAAMSAIGAAPGVGDAAKLALKAGDAARTARSTRTTASLTTRATPSRPPRPGLAPRSKPEPRGLAPSPRPERPGVAPNPKPSARKSEPAAAPRREPSGRADPTPAITPARRSARRPDPSPSGAMKKPEPRRPDPQPGPTAPKKSEPSRAEGNPTPPGTRERPSRPDPKPETVGTRPPQRPETPASGRDPRLQETSGSVRSTSLERFTRASNRAEHLSHRVEHIHGHVDLLQQMQGGNVDGEPSVTDFAFAGLDALVGMRSGRGTREFSGRQDVSLSRAGRRSEQPSTSSNLSPSESSTRSDRQREIQVPGSEAQRQPHNRHLDNEEIQRLSQIVEQVRGDNHHTRVRFNQGRVTGYNDETDTISVRGSVYPDPSIDHPRSRMSEAATLAHEFGHANNRGTHIPEGEWRDEFRASYQAALHTPGLSDQDRRDLMHDAVKRVEELRENIIRFGNGQGMQLRNGNTAIVDIDRLLKGVRNNVHVQRWAPKPERRQSAFGEIEE